MSAISRRSGLDLWVLSPTEEPLIRPSEMRRSPRFSVPQVEAVTVRDTVPKMPDQLKVWAPVEISVCVQGIAKRQDGPRDPEHVVDIPVLS
jgi:hypothetical protein